VLGVDRATQDLASLAELLVVVGELEGLGWAGEAEV
jgi:hypothetical protein